jgi:Protein O-mannosyl-transferase TMEM260-like
MQRSTNQVARIILVGLALTLLAAVLYLLTLAPSVMPGDYAEFQFCAAILGVPHPTGYPLYILLGKLFTLLPVGDVAYRVNLSSAIYMAGAVGILYATDVKVLKLAGWERGWWAAGVGVALFAVSPTPWSMALVARSYALNALLVSCVVFSLISWRTTRRVLWFYSSCLFIGLSMVHHATTLLLLPAYCLYLLLVEWETKKQKAEGLNAKMERSAVRFPATARENRHWLRRGLGVLALVVGLSPSLFLMYRFLAGSPYYWGNPSSWKDFFNLLTGGPFHNQVLGFGTGLETQLQRIGFGIGELSEQFTPLGILVGLIGVYVLLRYRRAEAGLLLLMMLSNFAFAVNYSLVGYLYLIPTYLIWGVFISAGIAWMAAELSRRIDLRATKAEPTFAGWGWVAGLAGAILAIALVYLIALRYPGIDQSGQTAKRDEALALLQVAPQDASLYLDWEDLSVIRFYRYVYDMRRDLTLHSGDPGDWAEGVYCDLENGTAVFVAPFAGAEPPLVARDFALERAPMGWRVISVINGGLYEVPVCGTCATCR